MIHDVDFVYCCTEQVYFKCKRFLTDLCFFFSTGKREFLYV